MDLYAWGVRNAKENMMAKKNDAKARLDELANRLASELGIDSLKVRNLDRYDFHEVHVAALKRVLQRAFVLGMQAGARDLLAACKAVEALWRKHGLGDDDAESEPVWNMLRRAIAKAEERTE
jgi:hypothetical protein